MTLLEKIAEHFEGLRPQTLMEPVEGGFIRKPYGVPAGFYDQLWDWDAFFINIHLSNRAEPRPEYFRYWVENFVSAHREIGYPPGCVTTKRPETDRRDFSLKPFMAQSVMRGSVEGCEWAREFYDDIVEIVRRREQTNFDEATGLYFWDDAMQSGADNNVADSNLPETKSLYLSCDMNSFQHLEYLALGDLAEELGMADDAKAFRAHAQAIGDAMHEHLWNEELQSYDNKRRDTGYFTNTISYSNYVPLWAGIATQEQADAMVKGYLLADEHLMTPWGARSLSKQDRAYNNANIIIPYSNWCGPIWPIANYFYHEALMTYGYVAEAKELAGKIGELVLADLENIGSMHECYCAETGATLAPSVDQEPRFIEGGFIGWNLLVQDMLEAHE